MEIEGRSLYVQDIKPDKHRWKEDRHRDNRWERPGRNNKGI